LVGLAGTASRSKRKEESKQNGRCNPPSGFQVQLLRGRSDGGRHKADQPAARRAEWWRLHIGDQISGMIATWFSAEGAQRCEVPLRWDSNSNQYPKLRGEACGRREEAEESMLYEFPLLRQRSPAPLCAPVRPGRDPGGSKHATDAPHIGARSLCHIKVRRRSRMKCA
jgi:hypothetical protein